MSDRVRRAKIVCTIGPASRDAAVFREMVDAGMDAVRINFSHASESEAAEIISLTRDAVRETGRPIAVIADLQGPRIRVGDLAEPLEVEPGRTYCFAPESCATPAEDEPLIPTTYDRLAKDVTEGDALLLDDGRLHFRVRSVKGDCVVAEATVGGLLTSQKGINLPGVEVGAPSLSEKDRDDLAFARSQRVEYVALSFVRRPEDVRTAREALAGEAGAEALLISKIEKDRALDHLREIIQLSDAVMVARGDLGVELPYEKVPLVQKRIIRRALERARPVITATQMLDSMTDNPRPTRAEVSDVANALLDGTDAVMLSGETAIGAYPVETVRAMDRIIRQVEKERPADSVWSAGDPDAEMAEVLKTTSAAVAAAAFQAIRRVEAPLLVVFTRSGWTARVVSAHRPAVPILALTDQWRTYNQLALVWGVLPVLFRGEPSYDTMLDYARQAALTQGWGSPGQRVVVTAGVPFHVTGTTNMMRIEEL
jgi:pyruvate kinase